MITINKKTIRRTKKEIEMEHSDDDIPDTSEMPQIKVDMDTKQKIDDDFLQRGDALMEMMANHYKEQRDELRSLLKQYKHELRSAKKSTKQKKVPSQTGFTRPTTVPDDLATFVGVEKGTIMPRTKLTKEVYKVFNERGLHYEKDKRVLRTDDQVRNLFGLSKDVDNSVAYNDPNGLNFFTIQKYIAKVYNDYEEKQNIIPQKKKKGKNLNTNVVST
jgi:chromatin remodeling complex protein RSC6